MLNICVICMGPCSLEPLSVEHREIVEALVSTSVNLEPLSNINLLVCSSCVCFIKSLAKFRQTAIAGVTHFLDMWTKETELTEPDEVLIKEEPPDNDQNSLEPAFAAEVVPASVNIQDYIKTESQNELKSEPTENFDNTEENIPESTVQVSDTNIGAAIDLTEQPPSLNLSEEAAVVTHSNTSNCLSETETPAITTEAVTDMPNDTSKNNTTEEIYLNRLIQFTANMNGLANSARALCGLESWSSENEREARSLSSTLQAILNRFTDEIYQYFSHSQAPNANEISRMTTDQFKAEEALVQLKVRIQVKRDKLVSFSSSASQLVTQMELPELVLPTFSGDILQWTQFWDQFCNIIEQRDLKDVEKLQYLRASLRGEAASILEGIATTHDNYKVAIDALTNRYGQKTQIIDAHYSALYKLKRAENHGECRKTLSEIERHLRVLNTLGENIEHNYLRLVIMGKFPKSVTKDLKLSNESVEEIRNQLHIVVSAREYGMRFTEPQINPKLTPKTKTRKQFNPGVKRRSEEKEGQSYSQKRRRYGCIFCKGEHYNDQCTDCKTIEQRKSKLQSRCYSCFCLGHNSNNCKTKKTCVYCGNKGHNRAICPIRESANEESTNALHIQGNEPTILHTAVNVEGLNIKIYK